MKKPKGEKIDLLYSKPKDKKPKKEKSKKTKTKKVKSEKNSEVINLNNEIVIGLTPKKEGKKDKKKSKAKKDIKKKQEKLPVKAKKNSLKKKTINEATQKKRKRALRIIRGNNIIHTNYNKHCSIHAV